MLRLKRLSIIEGEHIFYEGQAGRRMFCIHQGVAHVIKHGTVMYTLQQGDHFGELALLTDEPRTADVVAATDMLLMVLSSDDFESVMLTFPEAKRRMLASANARVSSAGLKLRRSFDSADTDSSFGARSEASVGAKAGLNVCERAGHTSGGMAPRLGGGEASTVGAKGTVTRHAKRASVDAVAMMYEEHRKQTVASKVGQPLPPSQALPPTPSAGKATGRHTLGDGNAIEELSAKMDVLASRVDDLMGMRVQMDEMLIALTSLSEKVAPGVGTAKPSARTPSRPGYVSVLGRAWGSSSGSACGGVEQLV